MFDFSSALQNIQQQASSIGINIDWDPTHAPIVKTLPGMTAPASIPVPGAPDDGSDDSAPAGMSPMTMGLIAVGAFLAIKMFSRKR